MNQKKTTQISAYPPTGKKVPPKKQAPKIVWISNGTSKSLPPKPELPKDETKIYGLSTMKQTTSSFKLPYGEIRCRTCGCVNDPKNDYCGKCGKRL